MERLIDKILEFDNSSDNSVDNFNKLFDEKLPYSLSSTVEILEPYTNNGRFLSIDGAEPIQFLFGDQLASKQFGSAVSEWKKVLKDGKVLGAYASARILARDLEISEDWARDVLIGKFSIKGITVLEMEK